MPAQEPLSRWQRFAPTLTLLLAAPLVAEVLPGATRLSSLFVFPIEVCVWGGGAVLIRYAVRRGRLSWIHMLLLALALAIAEECLIQQTSLAPMVLQLKGETYARAGGVNYIYLLWALAYESTFVVFIPVHLVELIFPRQREDPWLGRPGLFTLAALFPIGSFLAWYSWTQIARPKVFHVPAYNPPAPAALTAATIIAALVFTALGPLRNTLPFPRPPRTPPPPWLLGAAGALCAALWYGLVLLAFGIAPAFPPALAAVLALVLLAAILLLLPRWTISPRWQSPHTYSIIFGAMIGSMAAGFIGFIGAAPMDLYFKIAVDLAAVGLMALLGARVRTRPTTV